MDGKSSGVDIPDVNEMINAQSWANRKTALQNAQLQNVNSSTPYGSVTYAPTEGSKTVKIGGVEYPTSYTQTTTLSPEQQQIYDNMSALYGSKSDLANTLLGNYSDTLGTPLDMSSLDSITGSLDSMDIGGLTDSIIGRIQPTIDANRSALENKLANQGIEVGSEAYTNAMRDFNSSVNDQYTSASMQAAGEQNRLLGLRNQGMNELLTSRQEPLNELASLINGVGVTNPMAGTTNTSGAASTDTTSAYNTALQGALQNQASSTDMWSSLMGLGGSLGGAAMLAFSDRSLKSLIRKIGRLATKFGRLNIYSYVIFGRPEVGVMADEVEQIAPHLVGEMGGGIKGVNYHGLFAAGAR